ncbi:MAG: penicillin-binding protein 2 [Candidatus Buchananbacteria bacterium]|jgi:penicillin-binding protein 2
MSNPFTQIEPIDLGRKNSLTWVEESVNLSGDASSGIRTGFLSLSFSRKKISFLFVIIFFVLIALLIQSFMLQIVGGEKYFALAENNRIKVEYNKAHRGVILDRNGTVLVNNLFGFSVSLLPVDLPKDEMKRNEVLAKLSVIIGMPVNEMAERLKGSEKRFYQPVALRAGIPYDSGMQIKVMAEELPGVELNVDAWRQYPIAESMSHVLGYIGKINVEEYDQLSDKYLLDDNIGKTGLEKQYEPYLKGEHGERRIEVDALGREKKIVSQSQPIAGSNIILGLDAKLQEKVFSILKEKIPNGRGSVIITNPQNGEVLALVDFPSFDDNLFTGGINSDEYAKLLANPNNPLFTRSIFGEYPSGSTVKPVYAAAALEEKVITKDTTVLSTGGLSIGEWRFPDWKAGGHGTVNVVKAIANSVNTFFYYIGGGYGDFQGLGLDRMVKYLKMFGLDKKTGIDLPGERSGFVPDAAWKKETKKQIWYIGDTYHLAIGQGDLLVTPMQVQGYLMAVANGGNLLSPRLAIGAILSDGAKQFFPVKSLGQVAVSAENLAIVREGMRETVVSGSARSLSSLPVAAAGKTGTAQWHADKPNHAWFIGFAPYDKPDFAITVLVEEGGEGSSVAVPIAKDIMQWWYKDRFTEIKAVK